MDTYTALFVDRASLQFKFWFEEEEMSSYESIEVWRSILGIGGPYAELTASTWGPAVCRVYTAGKKVAGKALSMIVGTTTINMVFTGSTQLSVAQMAEQIEYNSLGLLQAEAGTDTSGNSYLELRTTNVGVGAKLVIVGGNAAPIIGFSTLPPTNTTYGTDARPRLRKGVSSYQFEDPWGSSSFYYKTRLRRDSDGSTDAFSTPLNGNDTRAVTPDKLVRGTVRLVDLQGRPVRNRSILISTKDTIHNSVIGGLVVDVDDQVILTDKSGYASLLLLRGVKVAVGIAGTALVRDVVPPVDPSVDSFDLFDPAVGTDDAFKVMVPDINLAENILCQ